MYQIKSNQTKPNQIKSFHFNQIALAQRLEECGVDIIQTEGKMSAIPNIKNMGIQELIEIAAPTLAAAMGISRYL